LLAAAAAASAVAPTSPAAALPIPQSLVLPRGFDLMTDHNNKRPKQGAKI